MMSSISESFGSMVFDDRVMKARLHDEDYRAMKQAIRDGRPLSLSVADAVASAMRDWAIEHGATHFTHWFQPLTGITAEKHESFICPVSDGGVILEFSGHELIRGEPDASSFPSGGLRTTFEARGYTVWDPTSHAFIKDRVLCVPTAFCSYSGEALDKKTPLLRSMEALNHHALRILRLFGNTEVHRVAPSVGPEQEYFLIDRNLWEKRRDLVFTGRTLFGAKPPKSQELNDHYFGVIRPRVAKFMADLDDELWKLGILSKAEHNEVAPCQHELAPIYTTANIATDHNQLTMEIMQKVAERHGLVCLLHEKPFEGMNGSGKHNNWSLSTDTGINLLSPGETPHENAQFLLFLAAVIQAVDDYQDLLRASVATAGNDHRLGGNEAPPAIVSVFIGNELQSVLDAIEDDAPYVGTEKQILKLGVHSLPRFPRDSADRNRTSPFAFTGNKFEFRMVGSSNSIACANIMLNAAVAESLRQYADELEHADHFETALHDLIRRVIRTHHRILFNGNGYNASWVQEAESRGLSNLRTVPDCMVALLEEKNRTMLTSLGVFSEAELDSRYEIMLDNYCKTVVIEANTMLEMARKEILPAVEKYSGSLAETVLKKQSLLPDLACRLEKEQIRHLTDLTEEIGRHTDELAGILSEINVISDITDLSAAIRDRVLPSMEILRHSADEAESLTAKEYWPFPTYGDLLFG